LNVLYREMLRKDLQPREGLMKCVRICNFVSLYHLYVVVRHYFVLCRKDVVA